VAVPGGLRRLKICPRPSLLILYNVTTFNPSVLEVKRLIVVEKEQNVLAYFLLQTMQFLLVGAQNIICPWLGRVP